MTTTCFRPENAFPVAGGHLLGGLLCTASLGAVSLGAVTGETPDGPTLCPFRAMTGLPCPFCGVTRSLFALGHGDLEKSIEFSPLGGVVAVVAVVVLVLLGRAVAQQRALRWPRPLLVSGVALVVTVWVFQLLGGVA